MARKIAVLPGDGIGPEVTAEAVKVLRATGASFEFETALVGGAAYDDGGHPLPAATLDLCRRADAVLFGSVGGPKYDAIPDPLLRPELGALLPLRRELNLYANVRPAKTPAALVASCPLKNVTRPIDFVVVRELTGGIYFGEKKRTGDVASDTCVYSRSEIERIVRLAFTIARGRRKELLSVDKANVLETSRLWREVVNDLAKENPDIQVTHMLVDNCAMQMIRDPNVFDVIVTENMFGDILSDEAAMITGSLGLLPSASLSDGNFGLYEPIHGSAPDIAGQGKANPIAAILSAAMMLRLTFGEDALANRVEQAVDAALEAGLRTADLGGSVGTVEMGDAITARVQG
jgi:3-isopropylmalate dehydrogenase